MYASNVMWLNDDWRGDNIRDISILNGGHFAILATGVDDLTIDNIRIDTRMGSTSMPVRTCEYPMSA